MSPQNPAFRFLRRAPVPRATQLHPRAPSPLRPPPKPLEPFHVGEDLVTIFSPHLLLALAFRLLVCATEEFARLASLAPELRHTQNRQLIFKDYFIPTASLFAPLYALRWRWCGPEESVCGGSCATARIRMRTSWLVHGASGCTRRKPAGEGERKRPPLAPQGSVRRGKRHLATLARTPRPPLRHLGPITATLPAQLGAFGRTDIVADVLVSVHVGGAFG
ncbi:hypothetical protein C8R45DRAFT_1220948 [Mycena sanguinolenta]|nr:hypothetical protein C8R45DRAFT_1220948 [Mycena sanguinolenta]